MKEFTLSIALKTIGRHLIISIAIFFLTYLTLPNLNLIDEKHKLVKIVKIGSVPPLYAKNILSFKSISEILGSTAFKLMLKNEFKDSGGVSHFKVEKNPLGIVSIEFKDNNSDVILNTATFLMKELQQIDNSSIQNIFIELDNDISHLREMQQLFIDSSTDTKLTPEIIKRYADMQKIYDTEMEVEDKLKNISSINEIVKLNKDLVNEKLELKRLKVKTDKASRDMKVFKNQEFEPISFLYPVDQSELENYFPNTFLFFGISLTTALLYNLLLLNFKFRKSAQ